MAIMSAWLNDMLVHVFMSAQIAGSNNYKYPSRVSTNERKGTRVLLSEISHVNRGADLHYE